MTASLLAPLSGDFGPASALQLALIGAACGATGVWAIHFGQAILAESFTHALLPGLVAASLLGAGLTLGALAGVGLAYAVIRVALLAPRTSSSTAISSAVTLLVALGALLATRGGGASGFEALLFGDPLTSSRGELILAAVLAFAIAAALYLLRDQFAVLAFDAGSAVLLGVRSGLIGAAALLLLACAVSIAASAAGSLLALALLLGPAYGAMQLCHRIGSTIAVAAAAGALSGVVGIYISWYADWPAGASVAVAICLWAAVAAIFGSLGRRALPVG